MIYKIKIYVKSKHGAVVDIRCSDPYLKGFKEDLFDNNQLFLDCESTIIPKAQIKRIDIKKISEN